MRVIARSALVLIACLLVFGGLFGTSIAQEATPAGDCPTTTEEENTVIVERWFAAWDAGDIDAFDELLVEDHSHTWAQGPDTSGADQFKDRVAQFSDAFNGFVTTIDDVQASGDLVAARYTVTGTHEGPLFGVEPTGETVIWTGLNVYRFECGKIAESWSENDLLSLFQQLGVPAVPATPVE